MGYFKRKESASFTVIKGILFNKVCKVENLKIFKHKFQQKATEIPRLCFYPNEYRLFFFSSTEINFCHLTIL